MLLQIYDRQYVKETSWRSYQHKVLVNPADIIIMHGMK